MHGSTRSARWTAAVLSSWPASGRQTPEALACAGCLKRLLEVAARAHNITTQTKEWSNYGFDHRRGSVTHYRDRNRGEDHQDRAAAACVDDGAARPLSRHAHAGLDLGGAVYRPDCV